MPCPAERPLYLESMTSRRIEAWKPARRLSVGAEVLPGGGVDFRVWSTRCRRIEVVLEGSGAGSAFALEPEADHYFAGTVPVAGPGSLYRFRLDGEAALVPDPASRFQPRGPDGPSQVIDPTFAWTDQ